MRGFMIYEAPLWGNEENTVYLQEVKDASYTLKQIGSDDITCYLEGIATKDPVTKATCNKDDTYDFEEGALIALMKKCGAKKAAEACCEAFPHETSGSIYRENKRYIKRIKELEEENERLKEKVDDFYAYNKGLIDEIDQKNHEIISLKALKLTNESLKKENEKLKLDCEKLQHGYNDTDYVGPCPADWDGDVLNMVFLPGRACGKQYTALVNLFKKIDQKKVEAAYKEAYNTTLPVWQKEVLNQMYGVYKESKEKTELPRTLDINGTVYRKSIQIKDFGEQINKLTVDSLIEQSRAFTRKCVDEWLYKVPTKREQMWNDILACGDCEHSNYVEVKKEDLEAFAKECNEKKIFNINGYEFHTLEFWFADDRCIFQIFRKPAGFICAKSVGFAYEDTIVDYLPPMRWDLFEKGRIYIRVKAEHFEEFKKACKAHFEKEPLSPFTYYSNGDVIVCYTDGHFRLTKMLNGFKKRPIVNWEDVR